MRQIATSLPVVVIVVVGLLVLGLAPAAATQDAGPKILRIPWGEFPETLEPQQTDLGQRQVADLAFEGLTRLDEELTIVPAAAASWEFSDDGTRWTFHLRDDLVYSDGSPLTAERFRYAVERQCDPHHDFFDVVNLFIIVGCEALNTSLEGADGSPAAGESAYDAAKTNLGVRALDDRTLEIRLTEPAPYFPALASGVGFVPVKQEEVTAGGPEWWRDPTNWIGNGPFRVVTIAADLPTQQISLAPNEHYWGGRATLDGITYVVMDEEVALAAYQRGELDVMWPTEEEMLAIEADPVLSREVLSLPVTMTGVYLMNLTREPFTDKKVREAFAYAFDRESYCREVAFGFCTPTLSWIPPGVPGSITTDAYAFDPERARQALADSSYGGPENLPAVLWYVTEDDPWDLAAGEWLADQYRQVLGVELVVTPVADGEVDAMLWVDTASWPQFGGFSWYSDLPDPHDWLGFWTCGSEYFAVYIGYCNPEYDALVDRVNRELDPEKRLTIAEEAGRMLLADAPSVMVYIPTNVMLVKPHLIGYSRVAPQQWPGWWTPLTVDIAPST